MRGGSASLTMLVSLLALSPPERRHAWAPLREEGGTGGRELSTYPTRNGASAALSHHVSTQLRRARLGRSAASGEPHGLTRRKLVASAGAAHWCRVSGWLPVTVVSRPRKPTNHRSRPCRRTLSGDHGEALRKRGADRLRRSLGEQVGLVVPLAVELS